MSSRPTPTHIAKALRKYHKELGLVWNDQSATWQFTWNGEEMAPYIHLDGTPAVADLSSTEILEIVRKHDLNLHGVQTKKQRYAALDAQKAKDKEDDAAIFANAKKEAVARATTAMNGPKIISHA
jgi:hypothetical protein